MFITNNRQNSVNFSGMHIANSKNCIKNIETNIDLFQITQKDKVFLEKLKNTIKMDELYPSSNIQKQEYDRWHEMLEYAIIKSSEKNKTCIVAAKDKKPCGILTFEPKKNSFYLDCICTWPVETGKKVTLAGQTLFKHLFSEFLSSKAYFIDLSAISNGPFSVIPKYMRLGFKQIGGENNLTQMRINRERTVDSMKKLEDIISTTVKTENKDVNLLDELIV